jgi:thymidylate synthase (FAD)
MVTIVTPSVHVIGETRLVGEGLKSALSVLGAKGWKTDASSDAETLTEFGGRLCYMSFNDKLNPNVTRTRKGNIPYIGNILRSKHGSVLEHGVVNFALLNVTPVLTHELVRHRAGTAFSQLSGRFVRIDDVHFMYPDMLDEEINPAITARQAARIQERGLNLLEYMEEFQKFVAEELSLDTMSDFAMKKKITSAMRRFAPYGIRTHIMFSANHRALRHIIDVRNSVHAEEEPDKVFHEIGKEMKARYPALYQDMILDGSGRWTFMHQKV